MAEMVPAALTHPLLTVSLPPSAGDTRVTTLSLAGELDRSTERDARLAVDRALSRGTSTLVVDLSRLAFMDSSGVSLLLHAYHTLMKRHGKLILVSPPGPVRRILEVVRFSPLVPIYATLQQALAETSPTGPPA